MQLSNKNSLKLFICHDEADSRASKKLAGLIQQKFSNFNCILDSYYEPNNTVVKNALIESIQQCDLFVMVLSRRSLQKDKSLHMHLRRKYAEMKKCLNLSGLIFLFIDDPRYFSRYFMNTINEMINYTTNEKRIYKIITKDDKDTLWNNYLYEALVQLGGKVCRDKIILGKVYDVFISCKSEDYHYAKLIYDFLIEKQYRVFFSKETIPELGSDYYHRIIDSAIDRTTNMIVVTTSSENINSKWVEYEWRLFLGEILAGRKTGNLITVLAEKMLISDLPISLRNREAVIFTEIHGIVNFIKS